MTSKFANSFFMMELHVVWQRSLCAKASFALITLIFINAIFNTIPNMSLIILLKCKHFATLPALKFLHRWNFMRFNVFSQNFGWVKLLRTILTWKLQRISCMVSKMSLKAGLLSECWGTNMTIENVYFYLKFKVILYISCNVLSITFVSLNHFF